MCSFCALVPLVAHRLVSFSAPWTDYRPTHLCRAVSQRVSTRLCSRWACFSRVDAKLSPNATRPVSRCMPRLLASRFVSHPLPRLHARQTASHNKCFHLFQHAPASSPAARMRTHSFRRLRLAKTRLAHAQTSLPSSDACGSPAVAAAGRVVLGLRRCQMPVGALLRLLRVRGSTLQGTP